MEYTRAQVYTAIHRAADHIEANPRKYLFSASYVGGRGCPACMWGWIGRMLGMDAGVCNGGVAEAVGISATLELYRMPQLTVITSAACASSAMRAFAGKHFAPKEDKPEPSPMSFSQIMDGLRSGTLEAERDTI